MYETPVKRDKNQIISLTIKLCDRTPGDYLKTGLLWDFSISVKLCDTTLFRGHPKIGVKNETTY
jgi:hypothetical protein